MEERLIGALVALAVAVPATAAQARTITVDLGGGGQFATIGGALAAATPGDVIDIGPGRYDEHPEIAVDDLTLQSTRGAFISATSTPSVTVRAARVTLRGLTIGDGHVGVDISGPGTSATLADDTIYGLETAVAVDGGDVRVVRSMLVATDFAGVALRVRNATSDPHRSSVDSAALVGGHGGIGLQGISSTVSPGNAGPLDVDLVHATVAPAPIAVQRATAPLGGALTVTASRSILHGAAAGVILDRTETSTSDAATFVDAPARDFRLRAGAPGIDAGGPVGPGESATDLLGAPRVRGAASDLGAIEFVPSPPAPVATPPAAPAGVEAAGAPAPAAVVDFVGPRVRIVGPAEGARLHRLRTVRSHGRRHRVANVLRFSGRVDDPGGVADVGVTLRRVGARGAIACTFLDGAARRFVTLPCAAPPVTGATLDGGAWSWRTAAGLKMPRGSWELTVRATDRAGNPSTAVLHFTVT